MNESGDKLICDSWGALIKHSRVNISYLNALLVRYKTQNTNLFLIRKGFKDGIDLQNFAL